MYLKVMTLPPYLKIIVILIGVLLLAFVMYIASTLLISFYVGVLLTLLFIPFQKMLERKGVSRKVGALLSILVVFIFVGAIVFFIANRINSFEGNVEQITEEVTNKTTQFQDFLEENLNISKVQQERVFRETRSNLTRSLSNIGSLASTLMVFVIVFPMTMYFLMAYKHHYKTFMFKLFDKKHHKKIVEVYEQEVKITSRYLLGILGVVAVLAVCNVTALSIIGVNHAILFGIVAAFLNIIPIVGSLVGSALPVFYALFTTDSLLIPVLIASYFIVIQLLESSIITPKIVGGRTKVNPFFIILAVFTGAVIWGAPGMVLFIPLVSQLKRLFDLLPPLQPYGFLLTNPEFTKEHKKQVE